MNSQNDKPKCTLTDNDLVEKCNQIVNKLAKTGGKSWCLQVPVNFDEDPDILFHELGSRLKELGGLNLELIDIIQNLIPLSERGLISIFALVTDREYIDYAKEFIEHAMKISNRNSLVRN